jgi:hypothetical protein
MREHIQPFVKRHETGVRLQYGNQLLVDSAETVCLGAGQVELPKRNRVPHQKRQDNEEKAKRQAGTDIETMQVKSAIAHLFRPSGKSAEHLDSYCFPQITRQCANLKPKDLKSPGKTLQRPFFPDHAPLEGDPGLKPVI